jgi:hypothetical protein
MPSALPYWEAHQGDGVENSGRGEIWSRMRSHSLALPLYLFAFAAFVRQQVRLVGRKMLASV